MYYNCVVCYDNFHIIKPYIKKVCNCNYDICYKCTKILSNSESSYNNYIKCLYCRKNTIKLIVSINKYYNNLYLILYFIDTINFILFYIISFYLFNKYMIMFPLALYIYGFRNLLLFFLNISLYIWIFLCDI